MLDITSLTTLVSALRGETAKDSISPESLGSLLQKILDLLASAQSPEDYNTLQTTIKDIQQSVYTQHKSIERLNDEEATQNDEIERLKERATDAEDNLSDLGDSITNLADKLEETTQTAATNTDNIKKMQTAVDEKIPTSEKGDPNGVASLDEFGRLYETELPPEYTANVLLFGGFTGTPLKVNDRSIADGLILYTPIGFVVMDPNDTNIPPTYCNSWPDLAFYGYYHTTNGITAVEPHKNKIYIDTTTNTPYYYNGTTLVKLGMRNEE